MFTHRTKDRSDGGRVRALTAIGSTMMIMAAGLVGLSLAAPAAATGGGSDYSADISCTNWSVSIDKDWWDRGDPWSATVNGSTVASGTLDFHGNASASGTYTSTGGTNTLKLYRNGSERASDTARCPFTGSFTTQAVNVCQGSSPSGVTQTVGPITKTATSMVDQEAADDAAEAAALADEAAQLSALEPYAPGVCQNTFTATATLPAITICSAGTTVTVPAIEATVNVPPEGTQGDPITEQAQADAQAAADAQAQLARDDQLAQYEGYTDGACPTPVAAGGGPAKVFTATATASGGVELCLADGVTTVGIAYDVTGTGSGPTTGDAEYSANVATVEAVNASIAAQTPTGATLGACGAPIAEVPITVNPVLPATAPESVSVPEAATVPTSVPAGEGPQAPSAPLWVLAAALIAMVGGGAASVWLVSSKQ